MTVVIAAIVSVVICIVTVAATLVIFRRFSKSLCRRRHNSHHRGTAGRRSWPCLEGEEEQRGAGSSSGGYYPYLSSSTTTTTLTPGTPGSGDPGNSGGGGSPGGGQYCLGGECQVLRPLMITPLAGGGSGPQGTTTIYRATFANGQQAHVIPIGQTVTGTGGTMKNFRPITPSASHIYMEIDPVYNTSETLSDILVSDLSDDDLRRSAAGGGCSSTTTSSSDDSRGSGGGSRRYDGRHYQLSGQHLSVLGDNNGSSSISGLLCDQQLQQQRTGNSDYNNAGHQSMMMIGGEPLPITAASYGGQHLLRLDLGGQQQQQQLYPHQQTSGRFVGHSFGQQLEGNNGHHSWHHQRPSGHQQQQHHHSLAFQ
jgi:hypothetical protein